jgi:hypothetical protein
VTRLTRTALAAAALLVGIGVSACGGDTDAPSKEGSIKAFCEVFPGFGYNDDHQILDVAAQLEEIGPLPGMPEAARKGLEFIVANAEQLDRVSDTFTDRKAFEAVFGKQSTTQYLALLHWSGPACGQELLDSQLQ